MPPPEFWQFVTQALGSRLSVGLLVLAVFHFEVLPILTENKDTIAKLIELNRNTMATINEKFYRVERALDKVEKDCK